MQETNKSSVNIEVIKFLSDLRQEVLNTGDSYIAYRLPAIQMVYSRITTFDGLYDLDKVVKDIRNDINRIIACTKTDTLNDSLSEQISYLDYLLNKWNSTQAKYLVKHKKYVAEGCEEYDIVEKFHIGHKVIKTYRDEQKAQRLADLLNELGE